MEKKPMKIHVSDESYDRPAYLRVKNIRDS